MSSNLLAMTVRDMAFLIDKLNEDCSPLQFLRELTKNSIEAILNSDDPTGEIRWDVDWNRRILSDVGVSKLCVIDTGVGMTGEEMVTYINQLSSSIHKQSATGNFGVGAKISAAPLNPQGLVYLSWKGGQGYMIHLYRDPEENKYGLRRFPSGEFWAKIQDDLKPEPIKEQGTMVILLGKSEDENTIEAPAKASMPKKWILRYLNSRFYRFPDGIEVKAREGWELPKSDKHNFLRTVTGQGPWLDDNSSGRGTVRLEEERAKVHWWIISEKADINSGHYTPGGHVAMLHQHELYEMVYGNAGYARLQSFGVVFGCDRVVLYVEPDSDKQVVAANTARTSLMIDGETVDWSKYASAFRDRMPDELIAYQDQIGLKADHADIRKTIRERLKSVSELFRFGRYRPSKDGKYNVVPPSANSGGDAAMGGSSRTSTSSAGGKGGQRGDLYSLFAEEVGDPADFVNIPNEPEVLWQSTEDGTRSPGDMDDRAARYLPNTNTLIVNGDFRAFTDMVDRWKDKYGHVPGASAIIKVVVEEWFTQQLIETVMSALALKQGGKWSFEEIKSLWSEEALTAAVLPRYHIDVNIKRALGQKLGKLPQVA